MPLPLAACTILAAYAFPLGGIRPTQSPPERVEHGPISTRNGRVVCLPFLRFVPRVDLLGEGQSSLETGLQIANDARRIPKSTAQPALVEEDAETQRLSFLYSRGMKGNWEASVEVPFLARNPGVLDNAINWWHHHVLGGRFRVRDEEPTYRSVVTEPGAGTLGSATGLGDISLFARKRLNGRVIVGAGVKLPTGNARRLLGSGSADAGINVEYRTRLFGRMQLDAALGVVAQGRGKTLKNSRGLVHQELVALTYRMNGRDSWTAQWQGESSPTRTGIAQSDDFHAMLTFGYAHRCSDGQRLELYFSEDRDLVPGFPLLVNVAPDVTIGMRWVRRF